MKGVLGAGALMGLMVGGWLEVAAQGFCPSGTVHRQALLGYGFDDSFGWSMDIDAAGTRVVIGSDYYNSGGIQRRGRISIYERYNGVWVLVDTIVGWDQWERLGFRVSMSDDGNRIAASGSWYNNGAGRVFVYEYDGNNWVLMDTFVGTHDLDYLGMYLALSGDGNTLVIGAKNHDTAAQVFIGRVEIYKWAITNWVLLQTIEGSLPNRTLGGDVAVTSDGKKIVIGAPGYSLGGLNSVGRVLTYVWNPDSAKYVLVDSSIVGSVQGQELGFEVDISGDGKVLAVAGWDITQILVYEWQNDTWVLLDTIEGKTAGWSISMDDTGNRIVAGFYDYTIPGLDTISVDPYQYGKATIYDRQGNEWVAVDSFFGIRGGEWFGWATAISGDGKTISIGAWGRAEIISCEENVDSGVTSLLSADNLFDVQFGNDRIIIHSNQPISSDVVSVVDGLGRTLQVNTYMVGENIMIVDVRRLSAGVYTLAFMIDGSFKTYRFAKR